MKNFILTIVSLLVVHSQLAMANNQSCKQISSDGCTYTDCRVKLANYPQEIAILSPQKNTSNILQYHFHGFRFNNNYSSQFDRTLTHVIQGFQMERSVCGEGAKKLVIPFSLGQNVDYRSYFTNAASFEKFHSEITKYLNLKTDLEIHLSAHSGGGKTVAMIAANTELILKKISIYDGIYGQSWSDHLITWANKPGIKALKLVAVAPASVNLKNWKTAAGESPFNLSRAILLQNTQAHKIDQQTNGYIVRAHIAETNSEFLFEPNTTSDHYTIVTHWWD